MEVCIKFSYKISKLNQKYISKDTEQNIFCDVNNYDAQFTLKKQLFEIKDRYPDVMYKDLNSVQQLHIISFKRNNL